MKKFVTIVLVSVLVASSWVMAAPSGLTPPQRQEVKQLVGQYLEKNPKAVFNALVAFRQQTMQQQLSDAKKVVVQHAKQLYASKSTPVLGNAQGDVTVVEFLDYRCGHCREMASVIAQLIKTDPQVRVAIKQLPIFSGDSLTAAKMALAAVKQKAFPEFHHALLTTKQPLNENALSALALQSGLNLKRLNTDIKRTDIQKEIDANMALARALKLMGTPAFVIGSPRNPAQSTVVPGAISLAELTKIVKGARH